jgi:hypothetical protein
MGKSVHYITHATTVYRGPQVAGMPANLWESKLSNDRRITHSRFGLEDGGALYGTVIASFKKNAVKEKITVEPPEEKAKPSGKKPPGGSGGKKGKRVK